MKVSISETKQQNLMVHRHNESLQSSISVSKEQGTFKEKTSEVKSTIERLHSTGWMWSLYLRYKIPRVSKNFQEQWQSFP